MKVSNKLLDKQTRVGRSLCHLFTPKTVNVSVIVSTERRKVCQVDWYAFSEHITGKLEETTCSHWPVFASNSVKIYTQKTETG